MTSPTDPSPSDSDESRKSIDFLLDIPRRRYGPGEPITISSEFRNQTDREYTIWKSGYWTNHRVTVTDRQGREAEPTAFGRACRDAFSPGGSRDKNSPHRLRPGTSHRDGPEVELNRLFQLKPGWYRVVILYEERRPPTPLKLTSNPVEFEIHP